MKVKAMCLGQSLVDNKKMSEPKICSMLWSEDLNLFRIYPLQLNLKNVFSPDHWLEIDIDKHRTDNRPESYVLKRRYKSEEVVESSERLEILESLSYDNLYDLENSGNTLGVIKADSFMLIAHNSHLAVLLEDCRLSAPTLGHYQNLVNKHLSGYLCLSARIKNDGWIMAGLALAPN